MRNSTNEALQRLDSFAPTQQVPLDPKSLPFRFPTDRRDLAATADIQLTQEIHALIYLWVRNQIAFTPTYGAVKGSALTRETKSGNAFDIASLLLALLRSANLSSRYSTAPSKSQPLDFSTGSKSMPWVMKWSLVSMAMVCH